MRPDRIELKASELPADPCAQLLSCLLDGELDDKDCAPLLDRLRHDEQSCRQWALLNLTGDALRSAEVAAWHAEGFVGRVAAALDNEPTILAPAAVAARPRVRRWLLPGAGVAAAAAVLIVAGLPAQRPVAPETTATAAQTAPAVPVNVAATPPVPPQIDRLPALEQYLAAHRELAGPSLMPNSTPYLRTSGALYPQERH